MMVVDAVMTVLTAVVNGVFALLPSWAPPTWTELGGSVGSAAAAIDGVVPVGTIGACLGILLGLRLFLFAWAAVVYVYRLIPLKAT